MASRHQTHRHGYALSTLFLLIAACAVVIGMVTPVLRGGTHAGTEEVIGASIWSCVTTLFVGGLVGLFHYSRLRGVGWGVVVGGLIGMVCGPIAYVPPNEYSFLFTIAIGGSLMIVAIAAAIRLTSPDFAVEDETIEDQIVTAVVVRRKRHPLDPDPEDES